MKGKGEKEWVRGGSGGLGEAGGRPRRGSW